MRIIIDMQSSQSPYSGSRGVGRYTTNLVQALLANNTKHEFYLALNGAFPDSVDQIRADFAHLLPQDHIVVWRHYLETTFAIHPDLVPPPAAAIAAAEIIRETFLNSFQPDIIFSTNLQEGFSDPAITSVRNINSHALYVSTLHDLIPIHFKDHHLSNAFIAEWYYKKIEHAKQSDILLTVSEAARQDIVNLLGVDPAKVFVVTNGCDENVFNPSPVPEAVAQKILGKYGLSQPFLFYFGGNDLWKNVRRLLAAYGELPDETKKRIPLVLGGRTFVYDPYGATHNEIQEWSREAKVTEYILTPGFIHETDLPVLLKLCECFIFPSTHEGFGLPVLEAMACGAPVIGSNTSSIAEVINDPMASFDPFDTHDMARKLSQVLSDPQFRQALRDNGQIQAKQFSWNHSAKKLLDIFDRYKDRTGTKGIYFSSPLQQALNNLAPLVASLDPDQLARVARSLDESFPPTGKPTIYLDISTVVFLDDRSGIQRVTRAVAATMAKANPPGYEVELVYSSPQDLNFYAANQYKRNVLGFSSSPHDAYITFKPGDVLLFLDQAPRMAINHKEFIRSLRQRGTRVYFYVHDLIPLKFPQWFREGSVSEFAELMETVCMADGALCNSKATADDVKHYVVDKMDHPRLPFRIAYAHLGTDIKNSAPTSGLPADAEMVLSQLAARPTFLMVGTIEPRKGHKLALAAFQHLWAKRVAANLFIVGRWGWGMGSFDKELNNHPMNGQQLFWLPDISDEYLLKLYKICACLLAASEAEGFGLPLVEAAQHGLPIIARAIPVFREVARESAYYFPNNNNPESLALSLQEWLALHAEKRHPPPYGVSQSTWEECVNHMLDALIRDQWLYSVPAA